MSLNENEWTIPKINWEWRWKTVSWFPFDVRPTVPPLPRRYWGRPYKTRDNWCYSLDLKRASPPPPIQAKAWPMCFPLAALTACSFTPSSYLSRHSLRTLNAFIAWFSDDVNGISVCNFNPYRPAVELHSTAFPLYQAQCRAQIDPILYSLSCGLYASSCYLLAAFELKRMELFWKLNLEHNIGIQYNNWTAKGWRS